jgi:lysophospholipase L1-like esterase
MRRTRAWGSSGHRARAAALCLWLVGTASSPAGAGILDRVGAMGDSLTDESWMVEGGPFAIPPYENWVEQLVNGGRVSFGPYGSWPAPRSAGYQYNYARAGATCGDLIAQGQHVGLASEHPTLAFLGIGGNDFANHLVPHAINPYGDGEDPMVLVPGMIQNAALAIETVWGSLDAPTGTHMVLATVPDIGHTPVVAAFAPYFYQGTRERYRNAVVAYNDAIKAMAAQRSIPVIDLFALFDDLHGLDQDTYSSFLFGGVEINLGLPHAPSLPTDAFLSDGFHPGTVLHGIMASMFIDAVNAAWGTDLPPLSDQDILSTAGVPVPPSPETFFDVSSYIIIPEPTTLLGALAGAVLLRRRDGGARPKN